MSSRTLWGGGKHYTPEVVVGLLKLWGVEVEGLSVLAVFRQSRRGKDLFYFSVVGPVAAMGLLDAKREMLKAKGWRVGWAMGLVLFREMGGGAGVSAVPQLG